MNTQPEHDALSGRRRKWGTPFSELNGHGFISIGWRATLASAAVLTAAVLGCSTAHGPGESQRDSTAEAIDVFVGLPPYAYLVQRIGGDRVRVGTLLEAGRDAHSFALSPRQSLALNRSRVLFIAGMPFEFAVAQRLHRAANLKVIDVAQGLPKLPLDCSHRGDSHGERSEVAPPQGDAPDNAEHPAPASNARSVSAGKVQNEQTGRSAQAEAEHSHAPDCPHCEAQATDDHAMDPHVWLSPPLLKRQAERIAAALAEVDPSYARQYRVNLDSLLAELDALHKRIAERLQPYRGRAFYVFHPAFGYFADCYGLRQVAVEHDGRPPTQRQLRELIHRAAEDRPRAIFVQPQYDIRPAKVVADAIGAEVVLIDDLAPDVLTNLEHIAEKIAAAMEGAPAASEGGTSP